MKPIQGIQFRGPSPYTPRVNRTRLGPAVALLALALGLSLLFGAGTATATRMLPQAGPVPTRASRPSPRRRRRTSSPRRKPAASGHQASARPQAGGRRRRHRDHDDPARSLPGAARAQRPGPPGGRTRCSPAAGSYTDGDASTRRHREHDLPTHSAPRNFCVHYRWHEPRMSESATPAQVGRRRSTTSRARHGTFETRTSARLPRARLRRRRGPHDRQPRREVRRLPRRPRPGRASTATAPPTAPSQTSATGARRHTACSTTTTRVRSTASRRSNSLRVTAAHEFFHAIQFAYDVNEDIWFMEGTATWVEDEVYDSINDNYQFLAVQPDPVPAHARWTTASASSPTGPSCSSSTPRNDCDSRTVVRQFWEYADAPKGATRSRPSAAVDGRRNDQLDEPTSPSSRAGTRLPPAQLQRAHGLPDSRC